MNQIIFKDFDTKKISKTVNALERVKICEEEHRIFITKDDIKFNKCHKIPALLIRKNDPPEKQFKYVMSYFVREETANQDDTELIKKQSEDET